MVVNGNSAVKLGAKELSRNWPVVESLEQDGKHEGRQKNLVAEEETLITWSTAGIE